MKSLFWIVSILTSVIVLGSCKRDFNCKCFLYGDGNVRVEDTTFLKMSKNDAIFYCENKEYQLTQALIDSLITDTVSTCNLD